MKKKIIITMLCLITAINSVGCGSSTEKGIDNSDVSIEELQEQIEELSKENKKLKEKVGIEQEVAEQEVLSDDTVIAFTDKSLLQQVQEITGISGELTYGNVKDIRVLNLSSIVENDNYLYIEDANTLKYFDSLEELRIEHFQGTQLNIKNMKSLKDIDFYINMWRPDNDEYTLYININNNDYVEKIDIMVGCNKGITKCVIDISNNPNLKHLIINNEEIDLSASKDYKTSIEYNKPYIDTNTTTEICTEYIGDTE